MFVGYYEKFTEAAKAEKLEQWRKIAAGEMWTDTSGPDQRRGQLISRNGSDWVELYSSEGEAIRFRSEMMGCPDGDGYGSPGECPPLFDEIDSKN
ncbi:MAG: hypothetical protein CMJ49_09580 [Planctomycetaceae bacterium]|nr:hypothetical protein [Planctomycetaceae bacterium]